MGRWKAVFKKLLWPGWRWVVPTVVLGSGSLYLTFGTWLGGTPFAYVSYLLSAYGLTILIAAVIPSLLSVRQVLHRVPLAHWYLSDQYFKVRSSLTLSFFINMCYAGFKLACAVWYVSFWEGALAFYYVLLCAVRVYLVRRVPRKEQDWSIAQELRNYRATGIFLFALDLALSVIATQIVRDGRIYAYPGTLIYAAALYAFYSLTLATVNIFKYRKFNSPVLSAAKTVNLTTALVSIFNLETAMLAQFGADQVEFRLIMTACTAFTVCVMVLGMAVYMVISANKKLRRLAL